ncbi:LiaF transmembrane domain-containing protein [Pontibacter sp. 13R65]|uniref:LiaF transmembrane domain-containing protein n=1 Tax=Pontibacter sp. 13R65 TaxID=3127458 RepID=UPI00301D2C82
MEQTKFKTTENYRGLEHSAGGRSGRVLGGLVIIGIGLVLLAYQLGEITLPRWVFSWKMALILLGLFIGARSSFRRPGWLVLVLIGSLFLLEDLYPALSLRAYVWPIVLISVGLWVMLRPNKFGGRCGPESRRRDIRPVPYTGGTTDSNAPDQQTATEFVSDDYLSAFTLFGGTKKSVFSKQFKGGHVETFFGGSEFNLSQADLQGPATIDISQAFGGTKLIVPSHWKVQSDVMAILGGIDDKRHLVNDNYETDKILYLKGTIIFGGLDIRSY